MSNCVNKGCAAYKGPCLNDMPGVVCYGFMPRITNADRIRAMTDEELASFLWNRDMDIMKKALKVIGFTFRVDKEQCPSNVLEWLKEDCECGWAVNDSHIDEKPRENFCPNCGALMEES